LLDLLSFTDRMTVRNLAERFLAAKRLRSRPRFGDLPSGFIGFPMTYMASGKQYVAVPVGPSLIGNRVVRQLTREIAIASRGSALLAFALPD
jgi:hypothetical protein